MFEARLSHDASLNMAGKVHRLRRRSVETHYFTNLTWGKGLFYFLCVLFQLGFR